MGAFIISSWDPPRTQWIKKILPDEVYSYKDGKDVRQTMDGGFIIVGTLGQWNVDKYYNKWIKLNIYLVRTDKLGNVIWKKIYNNASSESASSVLQTSDGGFMVVGWTTSFGAGGRDVYIMKVD